VSDAQSNLQQAVSGHQGRLASVVSSQQLSHPTPSSHPRSEQFRALCSLAGVAFYHAAPAMEHLPAHGALIQFHNSYGSTCAIWERDLLMSPDPVQFIREHLRKSDAQWSVK
jgi:hypothetical protein